MKIAAFLHDAVFYPCSGFDGTPVRFLGNKSANKEQHLYRYTVGQSSANKRHIALPIFDLLIIVILLSISPTYHLGMGGASQQGILGGLRRND